MCVRALHYTFMLAAGKHSEQYCLIEHTDQAESVSTDLHAAEMVCHLSMQRPTCRPFSLSKSSFINCINSCESTASSFRCSRLAAVRRTQSRAMQDEEGWRTADRIEGSNPRPLQGAASGVVLNLLSPLPCFAQEHNGLLALAGICRGYSALANAPSCMRHEELTARCATDIDGKTAGSIAAILGPVLSLSILLMIVRIPLSWYPNLDGKKLPWVIAVAPTEPLLGPTRRAVPPVGGVDVAPVSIYNADACGHATSIPFPGLGNALSSLSGVTM